MEEEAGGNGREVNTFYSFFISFFLLYDFKKIMLICVCAFFFLFLNVCYLMELLY